MLIEWQNNVHVFKYHKIFQTTYLSTRNMCQFCQKHTESQHAVRSAVRNPFVRGVGRLVLIFPSEMGWIFFLNPPIKTNPIGHFVHEQREINVRIRLGFKSHRRPHPTTKF